MFFFKRNKQGLVQPPAESKWAKRFEAYLLRRSAYLQHQTGRLSTGTLRVLLVLCCVVSSSLFTRIVVRSLQQKISGVLNVTPIRLPQHTLDSGGKKVHSDSISTAATWPQFLNTLMKLKNHDSIQQHLKR